MSETNSGPYKSFRFTTLLNKTASGAHFTKITNLMKYRIFSNSV